MDKLSIARSITRISHEIIEHNSDNEEIVLVGIHRRGVPIAKRIQNIIYDINQNKLNLGSSVGRPSYG